SSNIGIYLLQSMLRAFQAGDPLAVDLWVGPNHDVAERLTNGSADVALMEWWSDRPGFTQYSWRREPLVVIVAPDHPWARRGAIEASELAGRGISLVIEAAVTDEVRAGQLVVLPLSGIELAKDLKVISPSGLPEAAPA